MVFLAEPVSNVIGGKYLLYHDALYGTAGAEKNGSKKNKNDVIFRGDMDKKISKITRGLTVLTVIIDLLFLTIMVLVVRFGNSPCRKLHS